MTSRIYPATRALSRAVVRILLLVASVVGAILIIEIIRAALLFRRTGPVAFYGFIAVLTVGLVYLAIRLHFWRSRGIVFRAPPRPGDKATFRELKTFVRYLIHLLKRVADHPNLPPAQSRDARQRAYDLESTLASHPLLDDLRRGISRSETETWKPLLETLDRNAVAFAQYKMHAVVRDAIEPPFPIGNPALLVYHQITLICGLVDCYLPRATLREYGRALVDVWRVLTGGDYFRIGQRLFDGVYRNSPPMGPAASDLAQALSVIWLTWTTAQVVMHRCRTLGRWTVDDAIQHIDRSVVDSLMVTRDTLIEDVLPLIKLRLRHSLGPAVADAAGFSEQVIEGIVKSVDSVVQGLRTRSPEQTVEESRRSLRAASLQEERTRQISYVYSAPDERRRRVMPAEP
ncbi:MAG: hypothetical protein NZ740_00335 [Kiritimatiellae bacterium]|nr:hypothetical protein [Kiritimatiellia bacterium]MDW8457536.1 hypothetical protein [Verrucomicrobiota bacterium]